ncbi:MAG: tetratricopeptide repeat protein [Methanotrichaceae archaeon]
MNTKEKVMLHKGMDKVRRMQYEEAAQIFDRVIATNPDIPEAWNNRGVALFQLGRVEEAIESYSRSLALDPNNLDALRNKGVLLLSTGRLDEALECYEHVLRLGGEPEDMESKATALVGMGRIQEALDCMLLAVKAKPIQRFEDEIEALKQMIKPGEGLTQ